MAVTNPYYEFDPSFIPGTKARSEDVNVQYQNIQNAFDLLPGSSDALTTGTATFAPESGSGNAYVVTMPDTRIAEADGDEIVFFATHTNTAAATINVDGLGAKAIVTATGVALAANDLLDGIAYTVRYDATNTRYQLMTPNASYLVDSQAAAVAAAADAVAAAASAVEAMQWAVNPEDDDVDSNPGEFSAYHWAQKALGAATTGRILTDITTASPPTNEAVSGELQIYDADETDQLARYGFVGSNQLIVGNLMHDGGIVLRQEDAVGTPIDVMTLDSSTVTLADGVTLNMSSPNGLDSLVFDLDDTDARMTFAGTVQDLNIDGVLGGIRLKDKSTWFVSGNDAYLRGDSKLILGYGGSTAVEMDGVSGVQVLHLGVDVFRTATRASGGALIYNDYSQRDTGAFERVLSESDLEAGRFALHYSFTTNIAATDPGTGFFKVDNTAIASATNIYIDDLSYGELDAARVLSQLTEGDVFRIVSVEDETLYLVAEIGVPVDNTGWWTIPITVVSSNGANFSNHKCVIDVQWNSTAGGVTPGTADGQMLLWDQTTDEDWEPTSILTIREAATGGGIVYFTGAGTDFMQWTASDGGVVVMLEPILRLQDSTRIDLWPTGTASRPYIQGEASTSWLLFTAENTAAMTDTGVQFQYPVSIQCKTARPATPKGDSASLFGMQYSTAGSTILFTMNEDLSAYPVPNYTSIVSAYHSVIGAAKPGARLFRLDTADFSTVTAMHIDDESFGNPDCGWYWGIVNVGDVLMMHQGSDQTRWAHMEVDSITDNTGWWTIGLTALDHGGTIFINADEVQMTLLPATAVLSDITATPTPAATEVAVWDSTGATLAGSSDFIISTTTFRGAGTNAGAVLNEAASATNPTLIPNRSDVNTGIGSNAGEQVSIICNGVEVVRVVDSGVNEYAEIIGTLFITEQADAHTDISGDGQIWVRNYAPNQLWFTNDVGDDYPVATARANQRQNTASDMGTAAVAREMINAMCFFDNSTAYTITLEGSSSTEFPVESSFQILNGDLTSPGTITITEGATTTLIYIQPDGTPVDTAGGCTMSTGVATVYRSTAAVYYIWGSGITA